MEYFFFASKHWLDFEKLKKYCVKYYNEGVAKIAFDDNNYYDFIDAIDLSEFEKHHEPFIAFGTDGYEYKLTVNGAVKGDELPPGFLNQILKSQKTNYKKWLGDLKFKEKFFAKYSDNTIAKQSSGINGYDKYIYINKTDGLIIPFRFKKAKKNNQPLVVYFSGGGTLGHNNFEQFREFMFFAEGKRIDRQDCNILCPQAMPGTGNSECSGMKIFTDNVVIIIKDLLKNYDMDCRRVYAYGTSFGAKCVWVSILNHSELFTGAVEAMGCYYGYDLLSDEDYGRLAEIPIWMAHSSDDAVVPIESDDYVYDKLKSLGADVKYTRWDKYGHGMSYRFYRQEPWSEWLLRQHKH